MKKIVFCEICGECLGEERPFYAKKHIKKFPNHRSFLIKNIIDPLLLDNPDDWFKKHPSRSRRETLVRQPKGNTMNITDKETVPD